MTDEKPEDTPKTASEHSFYLYFVHDVAYERIDCMESDHALEPLGTYPTYEEAYEAIEGEFKHLIMNGPSDNWFLILQPASEHTVKAVKRIVETEIIDLEVVEP